MTDTNTCDAPSDMILAESPMPFVIFTGANAAANHLLELVRVTTSSPALQTSGEQACYAVPLPVWSMDKGSSITKWMIGSGAPSNEPAEDDLSALKPDILLCPPGASPSASSARQDIQALHAALYYHPRSGGLVFENRSGNLIVYEEGDKDGQDLTLTKHTTMQTLLWKQKNYLQFGEHRFLISFAADSRDQVYIGRQFDEVIGCVYGSLCPSVLFNFARTPAAKLDWYIATHRLFPGGRLSAGIDVRTGQPLVVKRVSKTDPMARHQIIARLQAMYRQDKGPQEGILKALDVWCKFGRLSHNLHHEQGGPCHCDYIEYSMPIAEHSFDDMPWNEVTADDRIRYFWQTLIGLTKLHGMGILHGNISHKSLLILTEEGREAPASDEYLLKCLKAVLSVCMRPTKARKQSLYIAPELSTGFLQQYFDGLPLESGAQGTGGDEPVDVASYRDDASVPVGESCGQTLESSCATLNDATASVPEVLSNDEGELVQWGPNDTEVTLGDVSDGDVSDGDGWQPIDGIAGTNGTEADVWALAMSWLSTLIAIPAETTITRDIHSQLLDDLDAKTNSSSSTNEKIMALIIRDMLCWDPWARPSAADTLQHPAWQVIMKRMENEEDKKRKRGGLTRQDSQMTLIYDCNACP
ncbi:hypothetical protein BBK36DRAFT_145271 [Trichoderma citrinoviride]|uniref:Protein kinase domain-containing protein n=1 Tax=Trichoderma citrinoviride TaxID=58853 RepID=A0A2T4B200_9HYPO|nr:hypothetical protein BBK36DRAFT_145271 [Trichoderma citrinoviride]PTB63353.1 hypothetical protein BBK36DRAFT_145271 [Trichoderma citrinoviride]